jgi:hypothetical protein
MHLAVPLSFQELIGKDDQVNRIVPMVRYVHRLTGMDVNDPRTTFDQQPFSIKFSWSDGLAGNPLHVVLILAVLLVVVLVRRDTTLTILACCLALGFIAFCAMIKWQPWVTRLHLPLFVMAAPLCGLVFERIRPRPAIFLMVASLFSVGMAYSIRNASRPLLAKSSILLRPRIESYFSERTDVMDSLQKAAALLKGSTRVGFISNGRGYEYPLRVLIGMSASGSSHLVHVNVRNESKSCGPGYSVEDLPEKIVLMGEVSDLMPAGFEAMFSSAYVSVYQKAHKKPF